MKEKGNNKNNDTRIRKKANYVDRQTKKEM